MLDNSTVELISQLTELDQSELMFAHLDGDTVASLDFNVPGDAKIATLQLLLRRVIQLGGEAALLVVNGDLLTFFVFGEDFGDRALL